MAIRNPTDEQQFAVGVILRERGVFRARELLDLGLREVHVRTLVRRGTLTRIGRGLYASKKVPETPERTVAAAAVRVPHGVVCLLSAAHLHGLVPDAPREVWMALPSNAWRPRVADLPLRFVSMSGRNMGLPVEDREIEGVMVRVFDPAATVVHCFARRGLVGEDIAVAALRQLLARDPSAHRQVEYLAATCRVAGALRPHLTA